MPVDFVTGLAEKSELGSQTWPAHAPSSNKEEAFQLNLFMPSATSTLWTGTFPIDGVSDWLLLLLLLLLLLCFIEILILMQKV